MRKAVAKFLPKGAALALGGLLGGALIGNIAIGDTFDFYKSPHIVSVKAPVETAAVAMTAYAPDLPVPPKADAADPHYGYSPAAYRYYYDETPVGKIDRQQRRAQREMKGGMDIGSAEQTRPDPVEPPLSASDEAQSVVGDASVGI